MGLKEPNVLEATTDDLLLDPVDEDLRGLTLFLVRCGSGSMDSLVVRTNISTETHVSFPISLARLIMARMQDVRGMNVQLINENPLDCRRENVRAVSNFQSSGRKRKTRSPTLSKYKGVSKSGGRWRALIQWQVDSSLPNKTRGNRKGICVVCDSELEAARAYNELAVRIFGQKHARINDVPMNGKRSEVFDVIEVYDGFRLLHKSAQYLVTDSFSTPDEAWKFLDDMGGVYRG